MDRFYYCNFHENVGNLDRYIQFIRSFFCSFKRIKNEPCRCWHMMLRLGKLSWRRLVRGKLEQLKEILDRNEIFLIDLSGHY